MQKFKIIVKPLLGEKYVEGKKKKKEGRRNNAKFSAQALRSHQCFENVDIENDITYLYPNFVLLNLRSLALHC